MNKEQKNSLLGYIAQKLEGKQYVLDAKISQLLACYFVLVEATNSGRVRVETYVQTSLKLINEFKKEPVTLNLIREYEQIID